MALFPILVGEIAVKRNFGPISRGISQYLFLIVSMVIFVGAIDAGEYNLRVATTVCFADNGIHLHERVPLRGIWDLLLTKRPTTPFGL